MKSWPIYLVSQGVSREESLVGKAPPFGILYVGQALADAGYRVRLFHLLGPADDRLEAAVRAERPLFVGFSNFISPLLSNDLRLSRMVHEQGIKVVWGGLFSTTLPEVPLRSGYVDYVVVDEGERPAVKLARALEEGVSAAGIPGVGYIRDGQIELTPPEPPETDLDHFRFGLELLDFNDYLWAPASGQFRYLRIPFSRGCPFRCSFCYNAMNPNRQAWRGHSPEYLKDMVAFFKRRYGVNMVGLICDNAFGKVKEAMKRIEAIGLPWETAAHLRVINRDFLEWTKQTRCLGLTFGVESGSPRVLQMMNKQITPDEVREKISLCKEAGLRTESTWVSFVPGETRDDRKLSFALMDELWEKNPIHHVTHHLYRAFPRTPFWEESLKLGHRVPQTLEEWAVYRPEIYRLLGASDRHVNRLNRLLTILYNREKAERSGLPPWLRPWLRKRAHQAAFRGPIEETLDALRLARDKTRSLRSLACPK